MNRPAWERPELTQIEPDRTAAPGSPAFIAWAMTDPPQVHATNALQVARGLQFVWTDPDFVHDDELLLLSLANIIERLEAIAGTAAGCPRCQR